MPHCAVARYRKVSQLLHPRLVVMLSPTTKLRLLTTVPFTFTIFFEQARLVAILFPQKLVKQRPPA